MKVSAAKVAVEEVVAVEATATELTATEVAAMEAAATEAAATEAAATEAAATKATAMKAAATEPTAMTASQQQRWCFALALEQTQQQGKLKVIINRRRRQQRWQAPVVLASLLVQHQAMTNTVTVNSIDRSCISSERHWATAYSGGSKRNSEKMISINNQPADNAPWIASSSGEWRSIGIVARSTRETP